jgi:3-oxoacyl-[acyl-carrier protein] reductase
MTNPSAPSLVATLSGRVAVVTGASRGIGRAIALELARRGADVMVTARDAVRLSEVAAEIRALGRRAAVRACDLREPAAAAGIVDQTVAELGGLDVLVNNAGATKRGDFLQLTDEDWLDGYALKLHGAVRLTRRAWPHLRARGGSVVNIAGVGGRTPGPDFTLGGSVNGALLTFTKGLADAGVRDGVQVNAINPGYVRSDRFNARILQRITATGETVAAAEARVVSEAQSTRLGEPADIAHLVAFLVSPEARYVHGALIDADGGQTKTV